MTRVVGILGAGTMGSGIAQVAAAHGWRARLMDVETSRVQHAIEAIGERLGRLVEKGRLSAEDAAAARGRLDLASTGSDLADAELVIEAIVEDLDVKATTLRALRQDLRPDVIIATNTSSLSVTKIGEAIGCPERVAGMHFFNPAPVLRLVEVIAGDGTDPAIVDRVADIATAWGKTVARARDVPGFIVNHVARPYYLEAFRILEEGYADPAAIDRVMREAGGFRMGPLELTDLIGQDVNAATTRSVWEQLDRPPLLKPSPLQERLVADGYLGRKSGRGVYDHEADPPAPAVRPERAAPDVAADVLEAARAFAGRAAGRAVDDADAYVLARILVAIIVQAMRAHQRGVAEPDAIDTALRHGTNYPLGPFEWAARIGFDACNQLLIALDRTVGDDRFAARLPVPPWAASD